MDNHITNGNAQEPYEAPVIEDVPLRPEEQMLAGCKQPIGASPISGGNMCAANTCVTPSAS